jgi:O-antigen ligase
LNIEALNKTHNLQNFGMTQLLQTLKNRADIVAKWLMVGVFATFPVSLGLTNLLMVMMIFAWVVAGQYAMRWRAVKSNPVAWFLIALYVLIAVHALDSPASTEQITQHFSKYSKLLVCVVLLSLLTHDSWIKRCYIAFSAAMLFVLISAYLNIWIDLPWSKTRNQGLGHDHTVFGDYITQNIMMAFFVLLCLVRFQTAESKRLRLIWLAVACLASVTIVALSQGRTGFLLLCLVLVIFFLYTTVIPGKTAYRLAGCLIILATLGAAIQSSPLMLARFNEAYTQAVNFEKDADTAVGVRVYIMTRSIELLARKPLLGHGTAAYHDQICTVLPARKNCAASQQHPDNQYVMLGVDHGLLGIGLMLGIMACLLVVATKQPIGLKILMLGFVAMLFFNSFVSSSFWTSRQNHFFLFVLALLAAHAHHLNFSKSKSSELAFA